MKRREKDPVLEPYNTYRLTLHAPTDRRGARVGIRDDQTGKRRVYPYPYAASPAGPEAWFAALTGLAPTEVLKERSYHWIVLVRK